MRQRPVTSAIEPIAIAGSMLILLLSAERAWAQTAAPDASLCARFAAGPVLNDADLVQVADLLPDKFAKGEFETTEAFSKRSHATKEKMKESLRDKLGAAYIVVHAKPPVLDFLQYDADKRQMHVRIERGYADTTWIDLGQKSEFVIAKTMSTFDEVGTYEATNAFGAKATITRYSSITRGVSVAENVYPRTWPTKGRAESLAMSVEKGKSLKENAAILIVADPKEPFVVREKRAGRPTFTHRMDVASDTVALVGRPLCVALIDEKTKEIALVMMPLTRNSRAKQPTAKKPLQR